MFVQADEESTLVPPLVKVPKNTEFPFCIMRGIELEEVMDKFAQTGSLKKKALIKSQ